MNWIITASVWYLMMSLIGIVFFPITKKFFKRFSLDFGYSFSKVFGILFISYTAFIVGIFHILPFSRITLFILSILFLAINTYIFLKQPAHLDDSKKKKKNDSMMNIQPRLWLIIFEEFLFLFSFFFWVYVRGQEPSIHGLEKFMDFGFMNSIYRSTYFPPLDMWLSADATNPHGYPINYYYFGHLTGALLIKLSGIKPSMGYNLILANIFALSITITFSFIINIINLAYSSLLSVAVKGKRLIATIFFGILGSYILNLGGNLHTIYLFTTGYPNESPIPFWGILSSYHPDKYWYPNATRFIPFTIHEFPSYSYVVADLHGHVFDIPFVLLTLAILFLLFITHFSYPPTKEDKNQMHSTTYLLTPIFIGFMCAVHYMTNAFDGPIYLLLTLIIFLFIYRFSSAFFIRAGVLIGTFIATVLPFYVNFSQFANKIGVNCSPAFLVKMGKLGPFLFEQNNCQSSPFWMLFVLWGFFWIGLGILATVLLLENRNMSANNENTSSNNIDIFIFLLFLFGTFLIIIPEFFYIKDIYPAHFRANTMFKLGYQAFIMMSIATTYTLWRIKQANINRITQYILQIIFLFFLFFIIVYPHFAVPSYYGAGVDILNQISAKILGGQPVSAKPVELDGSVWLDTTYPQDKEIIDYLNSHIDGQPIILEAQGDSYTDYERISAYTGLPTVAGWWVHEWLWRGSSDVVGNKIPDIVSLYESNDINLTNELIKKYHIQYVIVSDLERQKYPKLNEEKFKQIGQEIFKSSNDKGVIYKIRGGDK